ncbi:sodium-dependent neutral amino acid transporter B(0)AT3-like isoform X2 [Gadus morhua]|uniref:sodium-dependent neutral amino acid transporter B(0)AT3-like isoform X2 n=1 Tax=Gadus morhua TaxID=8049 RepID=UPI0011B602C3|nr:sodium-dependent neutral amino acid transporter B(0)AT3-like isoform X2 [Gadus morhua]
MGKTVDGIKERPKWDNKIQYLLSCIGFAVGLGNVWRFPYLCQIYGGGAFLIPYLIALVFEGLPLLYLELAIGQRFRISAIGVWNSISPFLGGVGIASMAVSFLTNLYYNTILAWVLWYFFHSFQEPLPWSQCPLVDNFTAFNKECLDSTPVNYFWYRQTLNITPDIETSGSLQWTLVICLATAWCVIYICFIRGIETMGKAVYVTATFPYLVLTIFLIQSLTLPGSTDGLIYFFTPDWNVLKNPRVWLDAATQIFFSLSLAFGGLIAFSSYNPEKNNCERDAVLVGVINSITSIYAAIPIFSILGFKATNNYNSCRMSTRPNEVAEVKLRSCDLQKFLDQSVSGTGLAFIVFTEAVINMPGSQVWAVLFFVMLFSLGLSSTFGNIEGILTPIRDLKLVPTWIPSELVTAGVCLISFVVALVFTLGSGNYWLEIFNSYVGSVPLLIIAFCELIGVIYFYGMQKFSDDILFMTGKRPNIFWRVCWRFISPLYLLVVFLAYVVIQTQEHPQYPAWNPDYDHFPETEAKDYPGWVFAIIVILSVFPVISIPLVAIYRLIRCGLNRKSSKRFGTNPYINNSYDIET